MSTTIDETWLDIIAFQYMNLIVPNTESEVYQNVYRPAIASAVQFSLNDFDGTTPAELAAHLLSDSDLRTTITDIGPPFTETEWPNDTSSELAATIAARAPQFLQGVAVGETNINSGNQDISDLLAAPYPQEIVTGEDGSGTVVAPSRMEEGGSEWLESLRAYQFKLAEENQLVVLPEQLKEPYALKQLINKEWIVPINAQDEDIKKPDDAAIAAIIAAQNPNMDAEELETEVQGFEDASRSMADAGLAGDVSSVYVLTGKGQENLGKMLTALFDEDTLEGIDLTDTSYENSVLMMDLVANEALPDSRAQAIFAWTGDDTIDTQNEWRQIDVDDKIYINQNDLKRLADYTNFSVLDLEQIAKSAYNMNRGIASKDIPWQIIALAIEQNQDYLTDDGTPITLNMMDADRRFSEYLTNYDTAINTYVDANGDAFAELAYLHLLAPDLAQKVYRGDHDQLTMGEVNFLNEAFNVIDTFHQNTAQFSPGWGTIMERKDWLTGLPPGKMSDDYLSEAQIDALAQQGIVAATDSDYESREMADLGAIDETRKAATEQMYRDMYELWFLDAPTDQELAKFMGFWASGEADYRRLTASWSPYTSGEFSNPNAGLTPEQQQARTGMAIQESLRADPQYQRMYGHKPTGMSESSYAQVFTTQATQDYGTAGTLNTGLRKRAMEAGDPGVITREGIITGEGYDNSRYMGKIMNLRNAFRRNT